MNTEVGIDNISEHKNNYQNGESNKSMKNTSCSSIFRRATRTAENRKFPLLLDCRLALEERCSRRQKSSVGTSQSRSGTSVNFREQWSTEVAEHDMLAGAFRRDNHVLRLDVAVRNLQMNILISNSKQYVDHLVGESLSRAAKAVLRTRVRRTVRSVSIRSYETASLHDHRVGLCLWPYGGP